MSVKNRSCLSLSFILDSARGRSGNGLAAIRAVFKFPVYFLATPGTDSEWFVLERDGRGPAALIKNPPTAVAFQKGFPSLDRDERNKEEA